MQFCKFNISLQSEKFPFPPLAYLAGKQKFPTDREGFPKTDSILERVGGKKTHILIKIQEAMISAAAIWLIFIRNKDVG